MNSNLDLTLWDRIRILGYKLSPRVFIKEIFSCDHNKRSNHGLLEEYLFKHIILNESLKVEASATDFHHPAISCVVHIGNMEVTIMSQDVSWKRIRRLKLHGGCTWG